MFRFITIVDGKVTFTIEFTIPVMFIFLGGISAFIGCSFYKHLWYDSYYHLNTLSVMFYALSSYLLTRVYTSAIFFFLSFYAVWDEICGVGEMFTWGEYIHAFIIALVILAFGKRLKLVK